jgi:hypothetical protein
VDLKKKARLDRFGGVTEIKKADSGELAAKLAARAERFALAKGAPDTPKGEAEKSNPSSALDRNESAQAKAAALVKPAANPEQEAKRQVEIFLRENGWGGGSIFLPTQSSRLKAFWCVCVWEGGGGGVMLPPHRRASLW